MSLSNEQQIAFDKFKAGHNLFISGPGGVGKSFLIEKMVQHASMSGKTIGVTALTGCAAILLGSKARTIHSWSGIKFMNTSITDDDIIKRVSRNKINANRWKFTNILVIDEVSMMPVRMFELLNNLGQFIRKSMKPFGGLQVIFTGDFYQLPPVCPNEEVRFCFESEYWLKTFSLDNHIELKTFFRQRDPDFIKILMEVRKGELSKTSIDKLIQLVNKPKEESCFVTKIYPTRSKVEAINKLMFERLPDEKKVFKSVRKTDEKYYYVMSGREELIQIEHEALLKCEELTTEFSKRELDAMVTNFNIIEELELKKGALVMLTINISVEDGLCNGSQGIVIGFDEVDGSPIVKFTNRKVCTIRANGYQNHEYPTHVIHQVPLCLAWALTIHKTQGATLEQIEVDIGSSVFEFGQTYVALSRVKTMEGLYLTNFDPKKIRANPKVKNFYAKNTRPQEPLESEATRSEATRSEEAEETRRESTRSAALDPDIKIIKFQ
jgi:ATP-dependent DNA helicase PIF1